MINISGRDLSINQEPYIIAELSANHGGSIKRAINTISAAKKAGADAIKIQTYNADSMTLNSDKDISSKLLGKYVTLKHIESELQPSSVVTWTQ